MSRAGSSPVSWSVGPLRPGDLAEARELVRGAGLPAEGLEDQFASGFVGARTGGRLVGIAGLEVHGRDGLLRSVAVVPEARGRGLGEALVRDRIACAERLGLESVHLLTTDASGFFERLGFRPTDRAAVPAGIRATREFAEVCPASAVAMARRPAAGS